ncbi:MAG: DNA double-strand break repair nuclease NurA [Chloroflexi bacterium]|nr:DNA double-strand break repair nuclease NurA [Chloroflexota bacterium]
MPVDFQSIHSQVKQWGEQAPALAEDLQQRRSTALERLETNSTALEALRERVERAAAANPGLRSAVPSGEELNRCFALPSVPPPGTLLAADGSQIAPNPHGQVEFCVINLGAFELHPGLTGAPREIVQSALLGQEELYGENGLISEDVLALMRDLRERRFLAELAEQAQPPVITMTDGPLELFRERVLQETAGFRAEFEEYLEILSGLAEKEIVTAGYVDKPRYDLVVRMLELTLLPEERLDRAGRERPLAGVRDIDLFRFLDPGDRSAVFAIQSASAHSWRGPLALHFFYLNVGRADHPWLARVEIPAWVAENHNALDALHACLFEQSRLMGARPYPYALHRAHEVAVVSLVESQQVEQMLVAEMYRRKLPVGSKSYKQTAKDQQGRTRYKP